MRLLVPLKIDNRLKYENRVKRVSVAIVPIRKETMQMHHAHALVKWSQHERDK